MTLAGCSVAPRVSGSGVLLVECGSLILSRIG
jgi:hypothetical protein